MLLFVCIAVVTDSLAIEARVLAVRLWVQDRDCVEVDGRRERGPLLAGVRCVVRCSWRWRLGVFARRAEFFVWCLLTDVFAI
jgi:hypothetical protein